MMADCIQPQFITDTIQSQLKIQQIRSQLIATQRELGKMMADATLNNVFVDFDEMNHMIIHMNTLSRTYSRAVAEAKAKVAKAEETEAKETEAKVKEVINSKMIGEELKRLRIVVIEARIQYRNAKLEHGYDGKKIIDDAANVLHDAKRELEKFASKGTQ